MVLAYSQHFSVNDAQRLIPWVEERLARLQHLMVALRKGVRELTGITDHLLPESFPPELFQLLGLMRAFEERGLVLRDPGAGVVHFPHLLPSGDEVVLCYLRGEGSPKFYHLPESPFCHRKPLTA